MRIIKNGEGKQVRHKHDKSSEKEFVCIVCECRFFADKTEYEKDYPSEKSFFCKCPECNSISVEPSNIRW